MNAVALRSHNIPVGECCGIGLDSPVNVVVLG